MFAHLTSGLTLHTDALVLRSQRQRILASNIANVDTPGYVAKEFRFQEALAQSLPFSDSQLPGPQVHVALREPGLRTHASHLTIPGVEDSEIKGPSALTYALHSQPSADGNTVDLDRERASFLDNAVHYEATLRFINGSSKTMLSAIQGQ
ncbi:flagellar basal body rod protein FlgB [Candidatus Symbiobacter mobilis]|uniref:Flagellar basal body rod protein FlgB n=1 Tax=Candidatus Symbiobacter mobilis CR TaxID=946483 RepID=U5N7Y3_9BURK|nr:flagellar basal body rod protein FlgB [Candidatus Symbiobacter mobilis]AGX87405.1 flagellar basal body rod protein FlgB [Candidatus Symbiobacter mobilis CR]